MYLEYIREDSDTQYGFLPLQNKILEVALYIDKLCREHNIDYCLMGGSALGAKRHGGFIPWDDDLDIFMTPDNYEKFRDVFNDFGDKEKFYLQELGLTDGMVTVPKLRMNGTAYFESAYEGWNMHHGIYVDIFILHRCPNSKIKQLHQCFWAKYVVMKGLATRGYTRRGGFVGFVLKVLQLFPDKMLIKHGLRQVYKYRNKNTDYFCNFLGKAVFKKGIYKREWFEKTEYAPFEKVELKIPTNLHDFLSSRFGDYMQIPSPERIKWEQHASSWDTDRDFREILNIPEMDFSDERKLI